MALGEKVHAASGRSSERLLCLELPDGRHYVTSLIFASNRWGNDTGIDYLAEAKNILDCSMQKAGMDRVAPFINLEQKLITFTPDPWGERFTDPSYHLPALYEVWARWADDGRAGFW